MSSEGYFTVTGSQVLRLSEPYKVVVSYEGFEEEKEIEISIASSKYE
jgi:hypothetical protein